MTKTLAVVVTCVLTTITLALPVAGQDSRVDAIGRQQAEKAASARAYEPSKAERIFLAVKEEFIDTPSGFYPLFGSVYGGGGFALGPAYRQYYGDRTFFDVKGLWSVRNYKLGELSTDSLGHGNGRLDLNARVGWRDATQVAYYGLGIETAPENRANFRFNQTYAGAGLKARPVRWVVLETRLNYEDYHLKDGLGAFPTIQQIYTPAEAPGLGANPTYLHSTGSAGIDWRPSAGYARRGGLYEVRYHNYNNRNGAYDFERLDAEVVQHLPLLRENWVLSGRGLVNTTLRDNDTVPYFLLPSLGSGDTLRGYPSWRFRDRHSLLVQGEFRWIPNRSGLDMAIFYDAGKVTNRRNALDLRGLKRDVGAEVRFHGPAVTPLRIGIARGDEGWVLVFSGSAAF